MIAVLLGLAATIGTAFGSILMLALYRSPITRRLLFAANLLQIEQRETVEEEHPILANARRREEQLFVLIPEVGWLGIRERLTRLRVGGLKQLVEDRDDLKGQLASMQATVAPYLHRLDIQLPSFVKRTVRNYREVLKLLEDTEKRLSNAIMCFNLVEAQVRAVLNLDDIEDSVDSEPIPNLAAAGIAEEDPGERRIWRREDLPKFFDVDEDDRGSNPAVVEEGMTEVFVVGTERVFDPDKPTLRHTPGPVNQDDDEFTQFTRVVTIQERIDLAYQSAYRNQPEHRVSKRMRADRVAKIRKVAGLDKEEVQIASEEMIDALFRDIEKNAKALRRAERDADKFAPPLPKPTKQNS